MGLSKSTERAGYWDEPIKLIQYDNQMKPDIAVRMARKAILEDGAKVIMSHTNSAVGLALAKVAKEMNVIHVILHNEADEIMGSAFQGNSFSCLSTTMHSGYSRELFCLNARSRGSILLNQDYAFGHAVAESFQKDFSENQEGRPANRWRRLPSDGHKRFRSLCDQGYCPKPDVIITGNFGPDLPNLIKQARDLGLKAIFGSYYLDNPTYMNQAREAGLGSVTAELYLATLKTTKNQEFIKSWQAWFKKHYPDRPTFYLVPSSVALSVDAMAFLGEAIKKANSVEADKIIAAWEGMSFNGLTGETTMRACDHQIQTPGFIGIMQKDHAFKNIIDFPFLGDPIVIPTEKFAVPPKETGNPRCK